MLLVAKCGVLVLLKLGRSRYRRPAARRVDRGRSMSSVALILWFAPQRRQSSCPFLVRSGPACREIHSKGAVLCGAARLHGATVDVSAPGDLNIDETRGYHCHFELSFQESTGNSTGPQIDLLPSAFGHRVLDQNVADLQSTTRL
jgi:hypothetical protein